MQDKIDLGLSLLDRWRVKPNRKTRPVVDHHTVGRQMFCHTVDSSFADRHRWAVDDITAIIKSDKARGIASKGIQGVVRRSMSHRKELEQRRTAFKFVISKGQDLVIGIMYYAENEEPTHRYGVAIIIDKETNKSDHIIVIELKAEQENVNIIQACTQTAEKKGTEIKDVYEQLETVLKSTKKADITIVIMEDCNAKVGKTKTEGCTGDHGLEERNERGERLIELCQNQKLRKETDKARKEWLAEECEEIQDIDRIRRHDLVCNRIKGWTLDGRKMVGRCREVEDKDDKGDASQIMLKEASYGLAVARIKRIQQVDRPTELHAEVSRIGYGAALIQKCEAIRTLEPLEIVQSLKRFYAHFPEVQFIINLPEQLRDDEIDTNHNLEKDGMLYHKCVNANGTTNFRILAVEKHASNSGVNFADSSHAEEHIVTEDWADNE
ncbi:hypothetical protein ILUMI_04332 [Ignelater luminosus]|uniref:Craniofacial development protein 2-like n=1 Tax=Ignelater luminosus TaxID=2038154 RepID=A0A8K0GHG4_IGNLU|nr:hypothetical protein ILUMI_04332 [Ignelater luminosus]